MRIYPAIDILDGKCVRLVQGKYDNSTVYADEPAEQAKRWQEEGAEYIHAVDLNAARDGGFKNEEIVERIVRAVDVPVQLGGGIRSLEDIEARLNLGLARVILGTAAVMNPSLLEEAARKYGERIVVGIDALDGIVRIRGWESDSGIKARGLCERVKAVGIKTVIYTDIVRDGTLAGPNFEETAELMEGSGLEIIASGGVSALDDLRRLKALGIPGVIVGKALYAGAFTLREAVGVCEG